MLVYFNPPTGILEVKLDTPTLYESELCPYNSAVDCTMNLTMPLNTFVSSGTTIMCARLEPEQTSE